MFIQFDAFITSTRNEIDSIERELNARWLSRTGFVFDEMRTNEARSRADIGERSGVVGETAECIAEALERLDTAVEVAGNGSFEIHTSVLREVNMYRYIFVYPQLSQLKRMVSAFETQPINVFNNENAVTEFDLILINLISEYGYLRSQFEPFVDELIEELGKYVAYTNTQSAALFSTLTTIQNTFNSRVREVEGVLAGC